MTGAEKATFFSEFLGDRNVTRGDVSVAGQQRIEQFVA
jgi:hypothetical protein